MTLTAAEFYGGAIDLATATSARLPYPQRRIVRGAPLIAATYTIPKIGPAQPGGWYWMVVNRGVAAITVNDSTGSTIGTVPAGSVVFVLLLSRPEGLGLRDGVWRLMGAGNVSIGDQETESGVGFNFGNAFSPTGLCADYGTASDVTTAPDRDADFGFAVPGATPVSF